MGDDGSEPDDREVFRPPLAVVAWWLWALFALGNLIDLAVQGRDRISLIAALILLLVTGIVYVTARRPRLIADNQALTIVNPLREHRVGWTTVAGADTTDLLRVRCEWPDGDRIARRAIYCWAVHSPRRKQAAAELRAQGRTARRTPGGFAGFGWTAPAPAASTDPGPASDPLRLDAGRIVTTLTVRADRARREELAAPAPASTWDALALASIAAPGLALLIVALT